MLIRYLSLVVAASALAKENGLQDVSVHAVSCQVHRPLCHDFGVHSFPKVMLFAAGATNITKEVPYFQLHPFEVLNNLGLHTDSLNLGEELQTDFSLSDKDKKKSLKGGLSDHGSDVSRYKRTKVNVFDDAYLSLVFAFKNGVFTSNGPLQGNATINALHDWLDLLLMALPPTWSVQKLIKALRHDFDKIIQSEQNLVEIVDKFPPPTSQWSESCKKGEAAMGYTCGLWSLFHIITVGVVEWNLMISTDDNHELVESTEKAATTIRNFVANFFGCEVCRLNFVSAFDACAHDRCHRLKPDSRDLNDWAQLPVWLFETHNSVNVRLLKEKYEREELGTPSHEDEINKMWPLREDCPACWEEGGGWNDMTIYKFLRTEYW